MSYGDIKSLPISYRRWYIDRLAKHFKKVNEKNKSGSSSVVSANSLNIMGTKNKDASDQGSQSDLKKVERFFKKFTK
tara:strand:+ start:114 stop:344 length:231 start_codon:yes stop_codon:yes gene_type:complete